MDWTREILPFVAILYLLECLSWVAPGQLLFSRAPYGSFRARRPGLRLANLFPGSAVYTAPALLFPVSAAGIFVPFRPDSTGTALYDPDNYAVVPFEDLQTITHDRCVVHLGTECALRLPSSAHAHHLSALLAELRSHPRSERGQRAAEMLAAAFDLVALRARLAELERSRSSLSPLSAVLFVVTLVALPVASYSALPQVLTKALLVTLATLFLAIVTCSIMISRRQHPGPVRHTTGLVTSLLLMPVEALHVDGLIGKHGLYGFDHLTVAAAVLPRHRFLPLARAELHAAAYARDRQATTGWRWYWQQRLDRIDELLAEVALSRGHLLPLPTPDDPAAVAFCPHCGGAFRSGYTVCEECAADLVPPAGEPIASTGT